MASLAGQSGVGRSALKAIAHYCLAQLLCIRQGEGLGGLLIRDVLERAGPAGWPRVLLVGDAPYYERFGFKPLNGVVMPPPTNPARVLGYGPWAGVRGRVRKRLD